MQIRVLITVIFFTFTAAASFAEEITMQRFLELVKANHPFFKKEDLSPEIEKKQAESYPGAQDWGLSVSPSFSRLGEATSFYETSVYERMYLLGTEAALNRQIWDTGGTLGFSISTGYTNSKYLEKPLIGSRISRAYRHGAGMSYTQPLIQNYKGTLDRLEYELSDYTVENAEVTARENKENFLLSVALRYLDWVELTEMIAIAKERLSLANEQFSQVEKKFNANLVDRVDVLRAEDAVRLAEQTILQLESQWKAVQAELAVTAGSDTLYDNSPSYDIYYLEDLPGPDDASAVLEERSRLLKTFDILKDQLGRQKEGLLEQIRPQLNLTVAGGVYGSDEEFVESLYIYKPDVTVSLVFLKLFGNSTLNKQIEKLDLQVKQIEMDRENVLVGLEANLRNLLIQLTETEKILALNREQIESAREKTDEELKMYNQGRGQLTFVIQSRDNEENAKLTYADNAAQYHVLLLQFRALLDELF